MEGEWRYACGSRIREGWTAGWQERRVMLADIEKIASSDGPLVSKSESNSKWHRDEDDTGDER
jgi:hypothetical protein